MANQIHFFMVEQDERELLRKLEPWKLDVYPEVTEDDGEPVAEMATSETELNGPGFYFAVGDVSGYAVKRGVNRGKWKIDEVDSPVVYFERSQLDENGALRAGKFWVELEASGDYARTGGKPDRLRRLWLEIYGFLKVRYRKSKPTGFYVGPHAAREAQGGLILREAGRGGETIEAYR
jgi:hypothetical protein